MSSKTKKVKMNIEILAEHVDKLENFMANLGVYDKEPKSSFFRDLKQLEVSKILYHKKEQGKWSFFIEFKNGTKEWITDENCNCEYLISQYLHKLGKNTAYLVCRVSTKEQATSTNTSLDAQESEMKKFVSQEDFDRIKTYKISNSAYRSIPDTLCSIGEACQKNDSIFIWRVDRLSRNIVKYLSWLEELNSIGVSIYSTSEKLYYKDNKLEFIQSIVNAQKEAAILGERVKLSNKRKRERGDQSIGSLPYGKRYKRIINDDGSTKYKIVINNKEEANLIFKIKKEKKIKANRIIAEELNNKNILKRGRKWTTGMVNRI